MNVLGYDEMLAATVGHLWKQANHVARRSIDNISGRGLFGGKTQVALPAGQTRQGQCAAKDELSALPS